MTEVNSVVMDLVAFKMKAKITAVLHHVSKAKLALHNKECPSHGLARSLHKARQSLKKDWQDKYPSYHISALASSLLLQPWIWSHICRVNLPNKDT